MLGGAKKMKDRSWNGKMLFWYFKCSDAVRTIGVGDGPEEPHASGSRLPASLAFLGELGMI